MGKTRTYFGTTRWLVASLLSVIQFVSRVGFDHPISHIIFAGSGLIGQLIRPYNPIVGLSVSTLILLLIAAPFLSKVQIGSRDAHIHSVTPVGVLLLVVVFTQGLLVTEHQEMWPFLTVLFVGSLVTALIIRRNVGHWIGALVYGTRYTVGLAAVAVIAVLLSRYSPLFEVVAFSMGCYRLATGTQSKRVVLLTELETELTETVRSLNSDPTGVVLLAISVVSIHLAAIYYTPEVTVHLFSPDFLRLHISIISDMPQIATLEALFYVSFFVPLSYSIYSFFFWLQEIRRVSGLLDYQSGGHPYHIEQSLPKRFSGTGYLLLPCGLLVTLNQLKHELANFNPVLFFHTRPSVIATFFLFLTVLLCSVISLSVPSVRDHFSKKWNWLPAIDRPVAIKTELRFVIGTSLVHILTVMTVIAYSGRVPLFGIWYLLIWLLLVTEGLIISYGENVLRYGCIVAHMCSISLLPVSVRHRGAFAIYLLVLIWYSVSVVEREYSSSVECDDDHRLAALRARDMVRR